MEAQTGKAEYKILIIDDDEDFIAATKAVLESRPEFTVLTAGDAVFAYPIARTERPDLIILDIIMPFEDGFSAAAKFKDDPEFAHVPIIILSSFSQRKGETFLPVSSGLELEADAYITKPVSPDELLRRIDSLLK
jgi:two-component system alkaline phosphatase synthesis response regulator PhoP